MSSEKSDPLSGGLVYDVLLPFYCQPRKTKDPALQGCADKNERLLHTLAVLDEHHLENPDDDRELAADIIRLESKIDLLLEMVSKLVVSSEKLSPIQISLSAQGVSWHGDVSEIQQQGALVWLHIMLDERLLEPLKLPAEICGCTGVEGGVQCVARFVDLGEGVTDLLEKVIFRYHRRTIAYLRGQQKQ